MKKTAEISAATFANNNRPSPFPVATKRGVVIDEVCQCGAIRSEHEDTISYGHGPCIRTSCPKFSWARFVFMSKRRERVA